MGDIRPYESADESSVVEVWYRTGLAEYTYLPLFQALTLEEAHQVFQQGILSSCDLWVGTQDTRVVAYLAMKGSYIDRLYVNPSEQGKGWGRRFIKHAKALCPNGLELHTHQENQRACRFYEQHGFIAVKFGVSPPPESVPDVEYYWRPDK